MIAVRDLTIVKVHYKDTLSDGKIVIPETCGAKENVKEYYGEVVSIGPDNPYQDEIKVGDNIIFHRNEGTIIKDKQGNEYSSLKPRAVLCKEN